MAHSHVMDEVSAAATTTVVEFQDLPYELVFQIFAQCMAWMPLIDLVRLANSSRLLYRVLHDRRLWCLKLNHYLLYPIEHGTTEAFELFPDILGPSGSSNWWCCVMSAQAAIDADADADDRVEAMPSVATEPTSPPSPVAAESDEDSVPPIRSWPALDPTSSSSEGERNSRFYALLQPEVFNAVSADEAQRNNRAAHRLITEILTGSALDSVDVLLCCHRYLGTTESVMQSIMQIYTQLKHDVDGANALAALQEDEAEAASASLPSPKKTSAKSFLKSLIRTSSASLAGSLSSSSSSSSSSTQLGGSCSISSSNSLDPLREWQATLAGKLYVLLRRWIERYPLFLVSNVYAVKFLIAWVECELSTLARTPEEHARFSNQYAHLLALLDEKRKIIRQWIEYDQRNVPVVSSLPVGQDSAENIARLCDTVSGVIAPMKHAVDCILAAPPELIARYLSKRSAELFRRIQPEELLWKVSRTNSVCPNTMAIARRGLSLFGFISSLVVSLPTKQLRAEMIIHWVQVMLESQKLLDFSTMLDIYAALVGSVVHRLKWSWQLVPEPLHQAMADIESLLSLSSYCKDFRLLHERSIARPCVPSLSAFIGHIHFLRDSSTNKLKVMHSVYSTISMVLRFKTNLAPFLEQELEDAELENLLLTLPQFNKDLAFTISRQREPRGCLIHEVA